MPYTLIGVVKVDELLYQAWVGFFCCGFCAGIFWSLSSSCSRLIFFCRIGTDSDCVGGCRRSLWSSVFTWHGQGLALGLPEGWFDADRVAFGLPEDVAWSVAAGEVLHDCYRDGNPERVKEFCMEFPTADALDLLQRYLRTREAAEVMADSPEGPI